MKIFLDANILVAVINKEYPVYSNAARILSLSKPLYNLYTSPLCLAIAFYFATKKYGEEKAKKYISLIHENINVTNCGADETTYAINNKKIHDFEDGLQYYSALNKDCNCIITEDMDDYYFSEIYVFNCRDFLLKYFSK